MKLSTTKKLIHGKIDAKDPQAYLALVLRSTIELLLLPDNDFGWSPWNNSDEAIHEIETLISAVQSGALPERSYVTILFAPTGPIQEVSVRSGWGEAFIRVAEKFDAVERLLWSSS